MTNSAILFCVVSIAILSIIYTIFWKPFVAYALVSFGSAIVIGILGHTFLSTTSNLLKFLCYLCIFSISCLLAGLAHFIANRHNRRK